MPLLAYFITFTTHATWLRGDERGSVIDNNRPGTPYADPDSAIARADQHRSKDPPFTLSPKARGVVDRTIRQVADHRGWKLHALNVRTNHVHAVIIAGTQPPEKVMTDLKSWSTRRLREAGIARPNQKVWTTHGSTRYIKSESSLRAAVDYVLNHQ